MNVFENDRWNEPKITAEFYTALAKALGATDLELEHNTGRMTVKGVRLCFRQGHGAKARRLTVHAHCADRALDDAARRHHGRGVTFPEASIDPTRTLQVVARDIERRMIEKSAPSLAMIAARAAQQSANEDAIKTTAADVQRAFPALRVTVKDTSAEVWAPGLSARLDRDGALTFDRLCVPGSKAARILAIMMEP